MSLAVFTRSKCRYQIVMSTLAETLRARLIAIGDPARAAGQQAYMKSAMPYFGVSTVPLRQLCKALFRELRWPDSAAWQADVLAIWRGATHREERYAAVELTAVRAARAFQHMAALPMYEEMIVTGAWWDYVDAIAGKRFWALLENDRPAMRRSARGARCPGRCRCRSPCALIRNTVRPELVEGHFFLFRGRGLRQAQPER